MTTWPVPSWLTSCEKDGDAVGTTVQESRVLSRSHQYSKPSCLYALRYSRKIRRGASRRADVVGTAGERQMSGERRTSRSWPLARLAAKVHPVCRSRHLALHRWRRHLRVRDALYGFEVGAFARLLFKLELAFALQSLCLEPFVIADDAGKHGLVAKANVSAGRGSLTGQRGSERNAPLVLGPGSCVRPIWIRLRGGTRLQRRSWLSCSSRCRCGSEASEWIERGWRRYREARVRAAMARGLEDSVQFSSRFGSSGSDLLWSTVCSKTAVLISSQLELSADRAAGLGLIQLPRSALKRFAIDCVRRNAGCSAASARKARRSAPRRCRHPDR